MRSLVVVCIIACHSPKPPSAPTVTWSEQTFDANVRAELARRFPKATVTPTDDVTYRVTGPDIDVEVRFVKPRVACRADWSQCGAAVDVAVRAMSEVATRAPLKREQLRVVLRTNEKVAVVRAHVEPTVRPFSADAQWLLAADLPNTIRLDVTAGELGISSDEAWKIATDNTRPTKVVTQTSNGVIIYQDPYAPSALLFPAVLDKAARELAPGKQGKLLAVCPEENIVIYTIGDAREATALRDIARSGMKESQMPLSPNVMEWTGGVWQSVP
jgi:hypothetical protein